MAGQQVCGTHGGRAPQAKAAARRRLDEAADRMAKRLLAFAEREDVPAYVALAATESALDRAGIVQPTKVEVGIEAPWEQIMGGIVGIAQITQAESRARRGLAPEPPAALSAPGDGDVVDAEVVDEPPSRPVPPQTPQPPTVPPGSQLQTLDEAISDLADLRRRYHRR